MVLLYSYYSVLFGSLRVLYVYYYLHSIHLTPYALLFILQVWLYMVVYSYV
jgi:hypothetical protein